jgi:hypothetical protein
MYALHQYITNKIIKHGIEINMKLISAFVLAVCIFFVIASGCVIMTNKNTTTLAVAPSPSTANFSNLSDPGKNETIKITTPPQSDLKGSIRVSISGCLNPLNISVLLDNETAGTMNPSNPLFLMVPEGNHTITVCVNSVCENETVTTKFGKYVNVDFSDRLMKDVKFPDPNARPGARILDYYRNGNGISVYVEYINPDSVDHTLYADISVGYTFIDERTHVKLGDATQAKTAAFVKAGQKETKRADMYFSSGGSLISYGSPIIEDFRVK